ncbi:hypothetical protein M408DRAFT_23078 [Serendipita vermifera MAFF 305830]|uniref:Uncharacterized protein n=1 Tax=Serendipita vermifera MAFF 305830 TaxID=933852 RepID=A0A0C2WT35_SERVB|nr:hypothetical protein M408DRAFT_23078 [Serendipita vermifera MAFF 305830]
MDDWQRLKPSIYWTGYPYGNVDSTTIAGRPFPYGLWPLYWGNNITGSDEYGPALDGVRPGGQLVTVPLKTEDGTYNITEGEMYHIIGDRDSAIFMMISLVTSCHITPAWPIRFDPTASNSTVKMENVIQYYRASSFALAFLGYNNSFARGSTNTESTENTPIPDTIRYSKFHKCLDDVIVDALTIMNGGPVPGGTMAIVLGVLGALIPVVLVAMIAMRLSTIRQRKAIRTEALNYERFP